MSMQEEISAKPQELYLNLGPKTETYPYPQAKLLAHAQQKHLLCSLSSRELVFTDLKSKQSCRTNGPQPKIIACTFHNLYLLWFLLTEKYDLLVFNLHGQIIDTLKSPKLLKDATQIHFVRGGSELAVVFPDNVFKLKISINTNILSTKYLSSLIFKLTLDETMVPYTDSLEFVKSSMMLVLPMREAPFTGQFLLCWNMTEVCVYNLETGQSRCLKKVATRQNPLLGLAYSQIKGLLFVGNQAGRIKLYNFYMDKDKKTLLHEFEGHQKQIASLICVQRDDGTYLASIGLDHAIMVHNADRLLHMYTLSLAHLISRAAFISDSVIFCKKDAEDRHMIVYFEEALSNVVHVLNHDSVGADFYTDNQLWGALVLENQSMYVMKKESSAEQSSPTVGIKIDLPNYLHVTSPSVSNPANNYMVGEKFYVRTEDGVEILQMIEQPTFQSNSKANSHFPTLYSKNLTYSVDFRRFKGPLQATYFWVGVLHPLSKNTSNNTDIFGSLRNNTTVVQPTSQTYWCVGTTDGSILFFKDAGKTEQFEAGNRYHIKQQLHSSPIRLLQKVPYEVAENLGVKCNLFVSLCESNLLCFWKISKSDEQLKTLFTVQLPKAIQLVRLYEKELIFGLKTGVFSIFTVTVQCGLPLKKKGQAKGVEQQELVGVKITGNQEGENLQGHEGEILSVDCIPRYKHKHRLYITAGQDRAIKIWTSKKVLLMTIKFFNDIECAAFTKDGQDCLSIFLSHGSKLSYIKQTAFKQDFEELIEVLSERPLTKDQNSRSSQTPSSQSSRSLDSFIQFIVNKGKQQQQNRNNLHQPPQNSSKLPTIQIKRTVPIVEKEHTPSPARSPSISPAARPAVHINVLRSSRSSIQPQPLEQETLVKSEKSLFMPTQTPLAQYSDFKRISNKSEQPRHRHQKSNSSAHDRLSPDFGISVEQYLKQQQAKAKLTLPTLNKPQPRDKRYELQVELSRANLRNSGNKSNMTRMKILLESLEGYKKISSPALGVIGSRP